MEPARKGPGPGPRGAQCLEHASRRAQEDRAGAVQPWAVGEASVERYRKHGGRRLLLRLSGGFREAVTWP